MRRICVALLFSACASSTPLEDHPHLDFGGTSSPDLAPIANDDLATASDLATSSSDLGDVTTCAVTFHYTGAGGSISVAGEFNNWQPQVMTGTSLTMQLAPGLLAYKLIVDGNWILDPGQPLRKYVNGTENSAVRVPDCNLPSLRVTDKSATHGHFTAKIAFDPAVSGSPIDHATVTTRHGSVTATATVNGNEIDIDAPNLADGKYSLIVDAQDRNGRAALPLRLVFWSEATPFDWHDALIYMVMTDRFRDGDPSNNPPRNNAVDARADYHGGDLEGVKAAIDDGTFDALGVRALWISPFHTNPQDSWVASDNLHQVMGYHGYWPIKAREVDPRIGGAAALHALVDAAHAHGIRILQDFVVNHVHQEHEYYQAHPEWFRTGCVFGVNGCDFTTNRLEGQFAAYLPDVNWTLPAVVEQWSDDAVFWLDEFDLDGFRVDAVKHVEDICVFNMTERIRREFEAAGTRVFLTGETAMGWNDCDVACNADNYGTINQYMGPFGLDGQADFVLYHGVAYRVFAYGDKGMIHADYWTQQSLLQFTPGSIMMPFIGSQDTARMVTLSSYRGQDAAHDRSIPGNQWDNIAAAPPDSEPYARHRVALSWLLTGPGAPMLYYGDEYGNWGGSDPNNRTDYRTTLSSDESATLVFTKKLGQARKELLALRRGDYTSLASSEDMLVFQRKSGDDVAVVAINRAATTSSLQANLPAGTLHDRMGGPDLTGGSSVTISLPAESAAIYAP